ncbi:MAG TPA: universal stress protein [Pseudorhizobium sp.]|jgi:nucleotide-binding universal stress UspA family protein|nr:universal stress protein [Pseudorhizobium sp.]
MTKVLALIDGSQYAQSVCDHVAWIGSRTDISVNLLHVIGRRDLSTEPVNLSGNIGLGARTALLEELSELDAQKAKVAHKRGRLLLDGAKDLLSAAGVAQIETKLRNGDLVDTVLDFEKQTDLIVIGKRGEGADFAKGHLGSNLERVVRSTRKAIVIASRAFKPIQKVLIAFDGGSTALKAIDQVARNPILRGLACKLVMAATDTAENRRKIEDASIILKAAGFPVETEVVQGEPEKVISDMVERDKFDLLVMGAYSHSRLRSLFLGSTTTEMIRSCKVPVAIIR